MKRINNFTEALEYIHRLGFTPSGNVAYKQACLCALVDALKQAAGGYPYWAVCHRSRNFPWLSEFEVHGSYGVTVVKAKDVSA